MKKSRLEWKVGLFVLIGLVLLGLLLLQFSKGLTFFVPTYRIYLHAQDVGGVKKNAGVLMSGVQIGSVSDIQLAPDGKSVTMTLRIYRDFMVHKDAVFTIDQSGFLGDQYVSIRPQQNAGPVYHDGETARTEKPFNLQEFIGSSGAIIERVDQTVRRLDQAISNINEFVLSPGTLTNLPIAVGNLREISARAMLTMDRVNGILETNGPGISEAVTDLRIFSADIRQAATTLDRLLSSNAPAINRSIANVESSTDLLKSVMQDVHAGKGTAGTLLHDEQVAADFAAIASNLSITSSNLNRLGLWGILWKKKPARGPAPEAESLRSPKHQSR